MKIIPKYDQGGYLQYFAQYTAAQSPQITPQRAAVEERPAKVAKQEKDEMISSKDIIDLMKGTKGLTNEMQVSMSQLIKSMKLSEMLGATTDDLLRTFAQFKVQAETMEHNKAVFDEAVKQTKQDGALSDPAISASGNLLYQKRDGSLGEVSVETYLSDRNSYKVISNDQFINLRQYTLAMAFDQNYTNVLDNSMSIKKFNSIVKDLKNEIGNSEYSFSGVSNYKKGVKEGLEALDNLSKEDKQRILSSYNKDGVYDFTVVHNSNVKQIQQAIQTISELIPDNAKTWAAYKVGNTKENSTKAIVTSLLLGGMKTVDKFDVKYGKTKEGTSSQDSSSDTGKLKINAPTKFVIGGGNPIMYNIHSEDGNGVLAPARVMPLTSNDGDYLGTNALAQDVFSGAFSSVLDSQNISIAGHRIDPVLLNEIVIRDGNIASIDFPAIIDNNGNVVPDLSFKTVAAKNKADKRLKEMGININDQNQIINNIDKINKVYREEGLPEAYTQDGKVNGNTWRRFGVMNIQTTTNVLGDDVDGYLVSKIEDENIVNGFKQVMKSKFPKYQFPDKFWGFDGIYSTELWVPIKTDVNTSLANEKMSPDQFNDIEAMQQASQKHAKLTDSRIY